MVLKQQPSARRFLDEDHITALRERGVDAAV
jgi:hypothetical protein